MKSILVTQQTAAAIKKYPDFSNRWEMAMKARAERIQNDPEFPYVVTYAGDHWGLLYDLESWCRNHLGDEHGECNWDECEFSFETWEQKTGLEKQLDIKLNQIKATCDDGDLRQKLMSQTIDEHYKMCESRLDCPGDHSHRGVWKSHYVIKTGYDYGYQDFCFRNLDDAIHFKLTWEGEANDRC